MYRYITFSNLNCFSIKKYNRSWKEWKLEQLYSWCHILERFIHIVYNLALLNLVTIRIFFSQLNYLYVFACIYVSIIVFNISFSALITNSKHGSILYCKSIWVLLLNIMIVCINQESQLILPKVLKNSEKHGFKCRYIIWIIHGYCSELKLMNYRYGMILITNMHCIHFWVYFNFITDNL